MRTARGLRSLIERSTRTSSTRRRPAADAAAGSAVLRPGTARIEIAARDDPTANTLVDRLTETEGFRVRGLTREPLPGGKGTLVRLVLADVRTPPQDTMGLSRETWESLPLDVRHALCTGVIFDDEVIEFGPFSLVVICMVPVMDAENGEMLRETRGVWNGVIEALRTAVSEYPDLIGTQEEAARLLAEVGAVVRSEGPAAR